MSRHPAWGDLPALALTEIYNYLCPSDRLQASATCWHWRSVLFQPRFFPRVIFNITNDTEQRYPFYLQQLAHLVSDVSIEFDSRNIYNVDLSTDILNKLSISQCLVSLALRPKYATIITPGHLYSEEGYTYIYEMFIEPIRKLLNRRNPKFKRLDLGCSEGVTMFAIDLLKSIIFPQEVEMLALASIKQDPGHYALSTMEPNLLKKFTSLQYLSLDYDYMTDEFLQSLDTLPIKRLIIHVHGLDDHHPGISRNTWANFANKHPSTELHLTLVYAYEAVEVLHSKILRETMPLTHLKVLFCHYINIDALEFLPHCFSQTLKSVVWIDSNLQQFDRNPTVLLSAGLDPLVMLAWRCKQLQELVIHGYVMDAYNLLGIAKLRGRALKTLEVSAMDLSPFGEPLNSLTQDIGEQLGQNWSPISKEDLNPALLNCPTANVRDKYVLKLVRRSLE